MHLWTNLKFEQCKLPVHYCNESEMITDLICNKNRLLDGNKMGTMRIIVIWMAMKPMFYVRR
jgi:hypothetical protein